MPLQVSPSQCNSSRNETFLKIVKHHDTQCLKTTENVSFEFWHFWWTYVYSKCKLCSLRSQCWMRLFPVIFKHCDDDAFWTWTKLWVSQSHFSSFTTIFDTLAETGISFDSETSQEFKNINQGSRAKVKQLCQKSDKRWCQIASVIDC